MKSSLNERVGSPFYFSFAISFLMWNWDIFYILLFESYSYEKFRISLTNYDFTIWKTTGTAFIYSLIYTIPNLISDNFSFRFKIFNENNKNKYQEKSLFLNSITSDKIKHGYEDSISKLNKKIEHLNSALEKIHSYYHNYMTSYFLKENNLTNAILSLEMCWKNQDYFSNDIGKSVGLLNIDSNERRPILTNSPDFNTNSRLDEKGIILAVYEKEILIAKKGTIPLEFFKNSISNYEELFNKIQKKEFGIEIYLSKVPGTMIAHFNTPETKNEASINYYGAYTLIGIAMDIGITLNFQNKSSLPMHFF
ncbi:hypothetical protein [Leptospira mayottensis]|uniref:Uncharacterized protein n=2 Tax=Leptospira mayottensis TaxID=1137606 RepID=A0AA87MMV2_9LEPT|nr:hypothetical protein [Leptospira mayottensis]EKR98784.1 hypothetical protein LEP1GSC125_1515 [Leptospira mayottensis 200901122]